MIRCQGQFGHVAAGRGGRERGGHGVVERAVRVLGCRVLRGLLQNSVRYTTRRLPTQSSAMARVGISPSHLSWGRRGCGEGSAWPCPHVAPQLAASFSTLLARGLLGLPGGLRASWGPRGLPRPFVAVSTCGRGVPGAASSGWARLTRTRRPLLQLQQACQANFWPTGSPRAASAPQPALARPPGVCGRSGGVSGSRRSGLNPCAWPGSSSAELQQVECSWSAPPAWLAGGADRQPDAAGDRAGVGGVQRGRLRPLVARRQPLLCC